MNAILENFEGGIRDGLAASARNRLPDEDPPCPLCGADAIEWTREELADHACRCVAPRRASDIGVRYLACRLMGLCWGCIEGAVAAGRLLDATAELAMEDA